MRGFSATGGLITRLLCVGMVIALVTLLCLAAVTTGQSTRTTIKTIDSGGNVTTQVVQGDMKAGMAPPSGTPGGPTPPSPGGSSPSGTPTPGGDSPEGTKPGEGAEGGSDQPIAVFIPESPNGDKLISMSFDQADIDHVLKFLSEQSGKIIVKEPTVQTKVTVVSTAKITVADAFRILSALLSVKGFAVIEDGDILRVVPKKTALQGTMTVTTEGDEIERTEDYITHILQIENIDAAKLRDDLKPLIPEEQGHLIANADTNTLIIIDTSRNVARMLDIIKQLDTDRTEVTEVDVIPLEFADAEELAQDLSELFEPDDGMAGLPADVRRRMQAAMGRGGPPGGGEGGQPGAGGGGLLDAKGQVKIVAETRLNALLVSASDANMAVIKDVITKVDIDLSPEVEARIVPLTYADPETVSEQINDLYEDSGTFGSGGGSMFSRMFSMRSRGGSRGGRSGSSGADGLSQNRVVPDVRTRSLIVTADEENMTAIMSLIKDLDVAADLAEVVRAIPLENAVATDVAETINNLISGAQSGGFFFFSLMNSGSNSGGQAPLEQLRDVNLVADAPTNTILLTGPPETFETLETLIKQLDRRVPQVYIEVLIADVTLGDEDRLGMEWSLIDRNLLGNSTATGTAGTSFDGLSESLTGLSYSLISNSVQGFMRTLETRSDVEILSSPNIIASDNTPATLSVGQSIPYQASLSETAGGSIQSSIDFVEVATTLVVTPHVNQRERISLEVDQTIDALIEIDTQLRAPITAKRQATTTVEVRDGQTVIIGGIISKQRSVSIQGVPILRKLPWIGHLFEDKKTRETRSELLVFLTPHIIIDDAQVDALTQQKSDQLTTNPLDDEEMRPVDLPPADVEARKAFGGRNDDEETKDDPKGETPEQPAPPDTP